MNGNLIASVGELMRVTAAAVVMPRFAALKPLDVVMKDINEPVTIADRDAERMLGSALLSLLPDSRVVGEEACSTNPSLLEGLGEGTVWIIDPIDGTANFATGRSPFAVMIALLKGGEVVGSWILDPLSDRLAVAELGSGAWIEHKRLRVAASGAELGNLGGVISNAFVPPERLCLIDRLHSSVESVEPTVRCAGHEYLLVATGAQKFALYWRTLVWDHAPGALLLTEAGGTVTYLDGTPYDPVRSTTGLLLAHNAVISSLLLETVNQ